MALQNGPSSGPVLTAHAFNCDVVTSARLGGKGPVSKGLKTRIGNPAMGVHSGHGLIGWTDSLATETMLTPPILEADSGDEDTPRENIDNSESHDETAVQGSVHNIFSR